MFFACRVDEKVLLDTLTTAGALDTRARQLTHSARGTEKASITSENCDPLHLEHTPDTTPNKIHCMFFGMRGHFCAWSVVIVGCLSSVVVRGSEARIVSMRRSRGGSAAAAFQLGRHPPLGQLGLPSRPTWPPQPAEPIEHIRLL